MLFNKNLSSILLVQSRPSDRMAFVAALESIEDGFLFGMAETCNEALDLLQRSMILPDLIFMELNLVSMAGLFCLKEIQTDPLTNGIPVIVFVASKEEKETALRQGAHAVIFKPDNQKEFRDQIETMLHTWSRKSTHPFRKDNPDSI